MSTGLNREDVSIKCPFYRKQTNNDKIDKISITCEPVLESSHVIRSIFDSIKDKQEQLESFCQCDCWEGCPIASMLNNNYY